MEHLNAIDKISQTLSNCLSKIKDPISVNELITIIYEIVNGADQSDQINEIAAALAAAQGEIESAIKDSDNPYFNSKYADLAAVWKACRKQLSRHGLAISQTTKKVGGEILLITKMIHKSGQWLRGEMPLDLPKDDVIETDKYGKPKKRNKMQAVASAVTYTRRIGVSAIAGVAPDDDSDDDGESCNLPIKKEEKKKAIEPEPIDEKELNKFIKDHRLDDSSSSIYAYLMEIAGKRKMSYQTMIEYCFRNKDGFFKAFKEYQAEKSKKVQYVTDENSEEQELHAAAQ